MKYKFEDIIFNITEKKKPVEEDKYNYIGLEHLESGNLFITKWGSDTAPEGEKIVMKKGDVLFGKRRAYQKKWLFRLLMVYSLHMVWFFVQKKMLFARSSCHSLLVQKHSLMKLSEYL